VKINDLSARSGLETLGYCVIGPTNWALTNEELEALEVFKREWDALAPDPYVPGSPSPRRRRHGEFMYDRLSEELELLSPRPYYQATAHNSLYGGIARRFAPIRSSTAGNAFCRGLLRTSVNLIDWPTRHVHIHLHLVRIVGYPDVPGEPSPEGIHRDGYPYISLHLMSLVNATGGETEILTSGGENVARISMSRPLEAIFVNDNRLLHGTTSISPIRRGVALRDVLLMSYSEPGRIRDVAGGYQQ
jgi:hypothetical protein